MLEIIGIIFIILVVIQLIDDGIEKVEKVEEHKMLKAQQLAMREDILLLTKELGKEVNENSKK